MGASIKWNQGIWSMHPNAWIKWKRKKKLAANCPRFFCTQMHPNAWIFLPKAVQPRFVFWVCFTFFFRTIFITFFRTILFGFLSARLFIVFNTLSIRFFLPLGTLFYRFFFAGWARSQPYGILIVFESFSIRFLQVFSWRAFSAFGGCQPLTVFEIGRLQTKMEKACCACRFYTKF